MLVESIVIEAATLLGSEQALAVKNYLEGKEGGDEALAQELLRCYNMVEREMASKYFPLKSLESFITTTGLLPISHLFHPLIQIIKVTDEEGNLLPYRTAFERLEVQAGKVWVSYTYYPVAKKFGEHCAYRRQELVHLFVYGIASEYCYKAGLYEEAELWERKYKEGVCLARKLSPCRNIRSRTWA